MPFFVPRRALAALPLAMLAGATPPAGADEPAPANLDETLRPYLARFGLPAIAAAVVQDGRIVAIGAVGTRRAGTEIPVTPDDRFHIGSDTKAMTALLAGMLVEEGKMRWDMTVGEALPDLAPGMDPGFRAITLEQLLSHTSGIPGDNDNTNKLLPRELRARRRKPRRNAPLARLADRQPGAQDKARHGIRLREHGLHHRRRDAGADRRIDLGRDGCHARVRSARFAQRRLRTASDDGAGGCAARPLAAAGRHGKADARRPKRRQSGCTRPCRNGASFVARFRPLGRLECLRVQRGPATRMVPTARCGTSLKPD